MRSFATALLLAALSLPAFSAGELSNRRAPGFALPDVNVNYHDLADYRGKVVLLDILQTSCPVLGAALSALLLWLLVSWLLHLVLTLLGGRGTSQGAINVVAWASLPFVLRAVVQIVAMLMTDQLVGGSGLAGFAPAGDGSLSVFLASVLGQIDLYAIWHILLVYIGARLSSRLPRGKCWLAVLLVFALVMGVRALPDVVLARFGDLTIIQPFL